MDLLLDCLGLLHIRRSANYLFFNHCVTLMGSDGVYSDNECALFAYRIVVLAYMTDIPFDPIKEDGLLTRIHPLRGRKIYHDAREALMFVKGGRKGERHVPNVRVYGGHLGLENFITEWRPLIE